MFGNKVKSKKVSSGCLTCPNNKFKNETVRDAVISDSRDLDLLFVI